MKRKKACVSLPVAEAKIDRESSRGYSIQQWKTKCAEIPDDLALKILDDLPSIGSDLSEDNSTCVLRSDWNGKRYFVHVDMIRKSAVEVSIREIWYLETDPFCLLGKTGLRRILLLMGLVAILLVGIVPYLTVKEDKTGEKIEIPKQTILEKNVKTSAKIDPELEQTRKENRMIRKRMETLSGAVSSLRFFQTNRIYSPKMNLSDPCTLEEKLKEFFSQDALIESLDREEILPWIVIEWRGTGSVPDIDRIFLTNQEGRSLREFLNKIP